MKTFNVNPPDKIPEKYKQFSGKWYSDFYFGKIVTLSGEESKAIVCYDFENKRWTSPSSGMKSLIEYYT